MQLEAVDLMQLETDVTLPLYPTPLNSLLHHLTSHTCCAEPDGRVFLHHVAVIRGADDHHDAIDAPQGGGGGRLWGFQMSKVSNACQAHMHMVIWDDGSAEASNGMHFSRVVAAEI